MQQSRIIKPGYGRPIRYDGLGRGLVFSAPFMGAGGVSDGLGATVRDHGMFRADGVVNGAPTIDIEAFGAAFKGDNSASNAQHTFGANAHGIISNTISIRFKRSTLGTKGIFSWSDSDQSGTPWILLAENGAVNTDVRWYFNQNYRVDVALAANVWTHHVATFDLNTTTWTVWIDGEPQTPFVGGYDGGTQWTNNSPYVFIGAGFGGYYGGWIDHVHIWERCLEDTEISQLFIDPYAMYRGHSFARSVRVYSIDAEPVALGYPLSGVGFDLD